VKLHRGRLTVVVHLEAPDHILSDRGDEQRFGELRDAYELSMSVENLPPRHVARTLPLQPHISVRGYQNLANRWSIFRRL
jgi:hypothetical protein